MNDFEINPTEYNPYFQQYIDLAPKGSVMESFEKGANIISEFFEKLPESKLHYRYAEGKWTPLDILQHIIDTERVFNYRALYFARNPESKLEGFDENLFALNAKAGDRTRVELLEDYHAVRSTTKSLFKSFDSDMLSKLGIANGNSMSVRAMGLVICGHELHHRNIIVERYL